MFKRKAAAFTAVVAAALIGLAAPALASSHHHHSSSHHSSHRHHSHDHGSPSDESDSDDSGSSEDDGTTEDDAGTASGTVATGSAQTIQVETTSYNFADNQGGNNATICCGVLHKEAAGDGTYANPITLAVPGSGGKGMQTPAGTRVYFEKYQFYGLVEDSGASPKKLRRFDIYSDGRGLSTSAGSDCMDRLTGTSTAILNPPVGKPVKHVGPLADASGCHA